MIPLIYPPPPPPPPAPLLAFLHPLPPSFPPLSNRDRGRKHFLPPRSLEMGFGLLFRLDDSCLAAHAGERREKLSGEEDDLSPLDKGGSNDRAGRGVRGLGGVVGDTHAAKGDIG